VRGPAAASRRSRASIPNHPRTNGLVEPRRPALLASAPRICSVGVRHLRPGRDPGREGRRVRTDVWCDGLEVGEGGLAGLSRGWGRFGRVRGRRSRTGGRTIPWYRRQQLDVRWRRPIRGAQVSRGMADRQRPAPAYAHRLPPRGSGPAKRENHWGADRHQAASGSALGTVVKDCDSGGLWYERARRFGSAGRDRRGRRPSR